MFLLPTCGCCLQVGGYYEAAGGGKLLFVDLPTCCCCTSHLRWNIFLGNLAKVGRVTML